MDILVISDSHGRADKVERLITERNIPTSALFFLGDGLRDLAWLDTRGVPLYTVCGNCDLGSFGADDELLTELGGKRIFASHGHRYSVKSSYDRMAARAASLGADIMLFGHTHSPVSLTLEAGDTVGGVTLEKRLHILNPGSIGYDSSYGLVVIRNGSVLLSHGRV